MKILIATPAYGGILTTKYFQAFIATLGVLNLEGHEVSVMTLDRDALISRARNSCAMVALENKFDKLMFIDADIVWKPEHILMLLKSNKEIIGGTYPYKSLPIKLVYHTLSASTKSGHLDPKTNELEVLHLPTGFMLIDISVFKKLSKTCPLYLTWDAPTDVQKNVYDFFPIRLVKQPNTEIRKYETEDWGFCSIAREAGFKIYLQTDCVVDHLGFYQFSAREKL